METATLIAQTFVTACCAGWMTLGVKDNIQHPAMNRTIVTAVLQMERLAEMYPDDYRHIAHRRITNPAIHNAVYRLIVVGELVAAMLLWIGGFWLALAAAGSADADSARVAALIGLLAFTSIWTGFLIAGNHFGYWYCHEWAQNTHFQLTIWGTAAMILVTVPA